MLTCALPTTLKHRRGRHAIIFDEPPCDQDLHTTELPFTVEYNVHLLGTQSSEVAGAPSVRDAGGHLEREKTSWAGLMAKLGEVALRTSGAGVLPALSRSACGDDARNRLGEDL